MNILAIESSCDETACAVVHDGRTVLSSVIHSQIPIHKQYGGVVPEIASRSHVENILPITQGALSEAALSLDDIDAVAVTYAPGLIGALLVGVNFAKGLCLATGKPLIPVHHLRGHIAANYIAHAGLTPPFLCLVVSGGHTHIVQVSDYTSYSVVGKTRDDAVGEAYDKVARVLGFPYPGGIYLDSAAQSGDSSVYKLPHPKVAGHPWDFSFSGLKTAVINLVHNAEQKGETINKNDLAASFQKTVCEILTQRFIGAANELGCKTLACAGGVCANSALRESLAVAATANGCKLYIPPLNLCGDNAAMIGAAGYFEYTAGYTANMNLNAFSTVDICNNYKN